MRNFRPPTPLTGHIFSFGRTGSGKSWKLMALIQYYHSHSHKIWDLSGGKRKEGGFWCFPSDQKELWFNYQKVVGEMKEKGPKEYEVDLMFPYLEESIGKVLPSMPPRITSQVFTLYFKDIEVSEIACMAGIIPINQQNIWNKLKRDLPDNANCEDILDWFEHKKKKSLKNLPIYHSFIYPLCKNKILQGKYCKYNLDLKAHAEDLNRIFVLCEEYTPQKYLMFFMAYIMRKLFDLVNSDKIHKRNLAFFRELSLFMKVVDSSAQDSEQKQQMRNIFSDIARYGRSGLFIAGDTQSPAEVKGLVEGQDDLLCLNLLPGTRDREEACAQLRSDGKIKPQQIAYLGYMKIEEMAVIAKGDKAVKLIKNVQPPRTMGWSPKTGTFFTTWKRLYNQYDNISEIIGHIDLLSKERRTIINLKKQDSFEEEDDVEIVPTESESEEKPKITKEEDIKAKLNAIKELENEDLVI